MVKKIFIWWILLFFLVLPVSVWAAFSNVISFGDSLSDTGNVLAATSGVHPAFPEYFDGRYSNGPVWVEYLANNLSADLTNYAYGGATTSGYGAHNVPGLDIQVGLFSASGFSNYDNALFTVWAGPNDFFQGSTDYQSSVDNIINSVRALENSGAKYILVPNMPDLGITPGALVLSPPEISGLTALTNGFNQYLQAQLSGLSGESGFDGTIYEMDVQQIMYDMMVSFDNTTDGCYLENGLYAWGLAGDYMFWDEVHPTTAAHMLLGEYAAASVPVPGAFWLLGSGLLFLVGIKRKA